MNDTNKKDVGIIILNYIIHFMKKPPKKLPYTSTILTNWCNQTMFDKDINIEREKYLNIIFDLFKSGDCDIVNEISSNCTTPRSVGKIQSNASTPTILTPSSSSLNYKTIATQTDIPVEDINNNKLLSVQVSTGKDAETNENWLNLHPVIPELGVLLSLVENGYTDINFKVYDNRTKQKKIIGGVKSIIKCNNKTISTMIETAQNLNNNNNNEILTIDLPDMVTYNGYMLLLSFYGCKDIKINDNNCIDLIQTCFILNDDNILTNALSFLKKNMNVNTFISFINLKEKLSVNIVNEMNDSINNFIKTNIQFIFEKSILLFVYLNRKYCKIYIKIFGRMPQYHRHNFSII